MNIRHLRSLASVGIICLFFGNFQLKAQGCVAIRGFSSCSGNIGSGANLGKGEILIGSNFRYFESFRHFRGNEEEENRVKEGTQVINDSYFLDLTFNYGITDRFYANLVVPFVSHNRSSMYEHGGNPPNGLGERHTTKSSGLSDIRIGAGYWLFKPGGKPFNYALGVGIKFPTGSYDYTDTFQNQGPNRDTTVEAVVDQSIQPGDGGYGFNLDFQGYHALSDSFMLTTTLYYLFNPMKTNGVLTRNGNSEFSVPDQFAALLGTLFYPKVNGLSFYLGGRVEGVPSSDIIGSSEGYRRPGYAISVDPGINYSIRNFTMSLNIPIAVERNRIQSYSDKERTRNTGVFTQGDAAFADYTINFNLSYRIGKKKEIDIHPTMEEIIITE